MDRDKIDERIASCISCITTYRLLIQDMFLVCNKVPDRVEQEQNACVDTVSASTHSCRDHDQKWAGLSILLSKMRKCMKYWRREKAAGRGESYTNIKDMTVYLKSQLQPPLSKCIDEFSGENSTRLCADRQNDAWIKVFRHLHRSCSAL